MKGKVLQTVAFGGWKMPRYGSIKYSGTSRKRSPFISGLGGRLLEDSVIAIWLTEERWSPREVVGGRFHCILTHEVF